MHAFGRHRQHSVRRERELRSPLVSDASRQERSRSSPARHAELGAVIAERFAAEGARVIVADVLDERGRGVAAAIGAAARYVHCDVTSEDDWARLITETDGAFGGLHVLVNNAAVLHLAGIEDTTAADYRRVFEVNELGTFLGIRAAIDPMRAAGGGSIVNISSIDGVFVTPGTAAYAASKFAVRGLTKTAALEFGRFGIRVNAVCPAAGNLEMVIEALPAGLRLRRRGRATRAIQAGVIAIARR